MELRHLRYFTAVAEELSFTRAAQRLHISQPPLSMQIKALEDELGVELFERDKRRVFLTQAGQQMLVRARDILAQAELTKAEVRRAATGEIARLNLGYTASAMFTAVLPRAIRHFQQQHPLVTLGLEEATSMAQLHAISAREIDVGVLRQPDLAPPEGLRIEPWYQTPLVAAVNSEGQLARRKTIRLAELHNEPFIMYPRDSGVGLYWPILQMCATAGFRPRIVREVQQASTMIGLVAAGVGVALLPADAACIKLEGASYMRLSDAHAVTTLHMAMRDKEQDANVLGLASILRLSAKRRSS